MHSPNFVSRSAVALAGFAAIITLSSCASAPQKSSGSEFREHALLDADWQFHRGDFGSNDTANVIAPAYDDHTWRRVQVPHDYILDGTYDPTNTRNHAYLPVEPAWYRKHFAVPPSARGKILELQFDGVFRDSQVWLNGLFLGRHASGYTGFTYDITKTARFDGDNVITVRVDPTAFEGWWYEGGGIYRHVYLNALSPLHIAPMGIFVTSKVPDGDKGADAQAEITVQTAIQNESGAPANCSVTSEILDPNGASLAVLKSDQAADASGQHEITQHTTIANPRLWSPDSPQLYRLHTTVSQAGRTIDSATTTFGIRTVVFDAERGLFLNGKHMEICGLANHQDFPVVGIAVPDSLQPWRVEQLKKLGCNAWRTAHNPPSESLLDACDRLGLMVMDENRHLGDATAAKTPAGSAATNLSELAFMIQRDRNHPSIIMWSMCNEEHLQGNAEGAELFKAMMDLAHRYDRTRPITSAMNSGWLTPASLADVEEIIGVNYGVPSYDKIHRRHPGKPMFGSEDTNQKTTRGEYADDKTNAMSSSFNLSDSGWLPVVERPFMAGSFTWTGFDYKGEPNPYGWPDVSNNTGLLDACGFPKDKAYYFQSCWSEKPMVHLLPATWNSPGATNRVTVFSNAREVELFLNGQSLGAQAMPKDGHLDWHVDYAPGKLTAQARTDGRIVATDEVETTGAPARIELSTAHKILHAGTQDTFVVAVSILDAQGRVVPDATNRVSFQLAGASQILGAANGNPADHDPDRAPQRNAFHGRCIAVIQAGAQREQIKITATSPGLKTGTTSLRVE